MEFESPQEQQQQRQQQQQQEPQEYNIHKTRCPTRLSSTALNNQSICFFALAFRLPS